jgi:hypothetical protein
MTLRAHDDLSFNDDLTGTLETSAMEYPWHVEVIGNCHWLVWFDVVDLEEAETARTILVGHLREDLGEACCDDLGLIAETIEDNGGVYLEIKIRDRDSELEVPS